MHDLGTTRVWVARRPGGLEVLRLVEQEVPTPGPGEVTLRVRAAGVNPADAKHVARGRFTEPRPVGYEVAGTLEAVGVEVEGLAVGDEVVAFRVQGGYADLLTVPVAAVLPKPASLSWEAAANLLLAGTTAAELLEVSGATAGATVVVHGASGAVGTSLCQQARDLGIRVVGTASPARHDLLRSYGAIPVAHGPGLLDRLLALAPPEGYAAALDAAGTDEAVDASLLLVGPARVVTVAAQHRVAPDGIRALAGSDPVSAAFRDAARPALLAAAGEGRLEVPVARTFPLDEAVAALALLAEGHPGGSFALVP